jgi:hypothetical protein
MSEDKDYIEEAQEEAQLRLGKELSAAELAEKFAGHDFEARVYHMKRLKSDEDMSVKDAARRLTYERALNSVHEKLRKINR